MPSLNLTKHTQVPLGTFINHQQFPNNPLDPEVLEKFSKDNYIIDRDGLSFRLGNRGEYRSEGPGYYIEIHYKAELKRLYVLYMNSRRKQNLYILNI